MTARDAILRGAVAALTLTLAAASAADATEFELTLNGVFNGTTDASGSPVIGTETLIPQGGGANVLTMANEPFTMTGIFDTSTGSLLPPPSTGFPSSGWVDYAPLSVTLKVGGSTYSVATYDGSIPVTGGPGLTVAIFDDTTIFSPAPPPFSHFAAGFIQNPIQDGAGIVGDWTDLSPGYTIPNLVTTTYPASDFYGVGFGSGPCPHPPPGPGGVCEPPGDVNTVVPIPLDGGAYWLTLGTYDLNNPSNYLNDPGNGPYPNPIDLAIFLLGSADGGPRALNLGDAARRVCGSCRCRGSLEPEGPSRALIRQVLSFIKSAAPSGAAIIYGRSAPKHPLYFARLAALRGGMSAPPPGKARRYSQTDRSSSSVMCR